MSCQWKQHSLYSLGTQGLSPCSSGHTPAWPGEKAHGTQFLTWNSSGMQEFSRDLLYIPKRGTCLEAMAGGDDKVWHLPQQAGISLQLVDDSCWKIPVYSYLHSPGRTPSSKKGDPRCASKNCQVKHLLSLIPQDTVGVKGIAQISPEQFALHWGSLGMTWWGYVGLRSGGTVGTLG